MAYCCFRILEHSKVAGLYAGLCIGHVAIGLFLTASKSRNVMLTSYLSLMAFLRARRRGISSAFWRFVSRASLGTGLLLKSPNRGLFSPWPPRLSIVPSPTTFWRPPGSGLRPISGSFSSFDRGTLAHPGRHSETLPHFLAGAPQPARANIRASCGSISLTSNFFASQAALSPRLQYRAANLVLAFSICFGFVPLERFIFPSYSRNSPYEPVDPARARTRLLSLC